MGTLLISKIREEYPAKAKRESQRKKKKKKSQ
jgi:hypothetical protein